jgi:hypothetical protein
VALGTESATAELVRAGYAWVYQKYATDRSLYGLEAEVKAAQRGNCGRCWKPKGRRPGNGVMEASSRLKPHPLSAPRLLRLEATLPRDGVV